jgi:RND family efflux transporter MFP subunit
MLTALGLARATAFAIGAVLSAVPLHAAQTASAVGPVVTVAVRDVPQTVAAEGVVEAIRQATLGAQVAGRIVEFGVKAGDAVRAGQVLARIDPRTADQAVVASRSQIAEAEANLANARRKFERNRELVAQKFVSQAALDQAEADFKAAQAQLAAMRANADQAIAARSFTAIVAPYGGVVGATHAELGDMAQPGRAIVTVFDPRELRVTATVPQAALARIDLKSAARIEIPAVDRTIASVRATVIPLADARTHTSKIRLDLPPTAGVLPGQFARAQFVVGSARAIAIPQGALVKRGEVTAVYVVDASGRAQLRQVRTGETVGDGLVEILSGLAPGETIAANPVQAGMAPAIAANR